MMNLYETFACRYMFPCISFVHKNEKEKREMKEGADASKRYLKTREARSF